MNTPQVVGSVGKKSSKIAIVGESPAQYEVKYGEPFTGPAGDNLNECLHQAGIARADCYLTNVIKDAGNPIGEYILWPKNGKGKPKVSDLGEFYINALRMELYDTDANVIMPLGNIALFALCGRQGIMNWRGSVIESTLLPGRKCIPTIHPAFYTFEKVKKSPKNYLARYLIALDMERVHDNMEFPEIRERPRALLIEPTFAEAMAYLQECEDYAQRGGTVIYDIELAPNSQELSCISFALGNARSMSIPFIHARGDYFNPDQELDLILRIATILQNPSYRNGGQNIGFDSHFMLRKFGIISSPQKDDTMIAQKILYPEFQNGARLNFISAMWSPDLPYWKADGKLWLTGVGDYRNGWQYNAIDSIACADALPQQLAELEASGNMQTYERTVRLIEPLTYMMEHGICVDREGMKRAAQQAAEDEQIALDMLHSKVGYAINPGSWQQLQEYFYGTLGTKPVLKEGKITTNVDAMKTFINRGHEEARYVLRWRQAHKKQSTFLDVRKVDGDGRIRCWYNPVGTRFGRISSSSNIFGTGMNLQNIPMEARTYFVADDGYVLYSIDLSQAENRIVAYIGQITKMIEVFESGLDMHRQTGSLIFKIPYDEVSDEDGSCPYGDGLHSQRYWSKKANHAYNYGLGPYSFAQQYECERAEGIELHALYHAAYPGVRHGYWAYIQECLKHDRTLINLLGRRVTFLGQWGESMLNEAYSCIPQGTVGEMVNEFGINYIYYDEPKLFAPVELLAQTHDSIDFQIPLSLPIEQHARILIAIKKSLEYPLQHRQANFTIPADLTIGFCLNKTLGVEVKSKYFSEDPLVLGDLIMDAINSFNHCVVCGEWRIMKSYDTCKECLENMEMAA